VQIATEFHQISSIFVMYNEIYITHIISFNSRYGTNAMQRRAYLR